MLNCNRSQGPDGIPARVLEELSKELAPPLSILFSISIESGVLPLKWKTAIVAPIFFKEHAVTQLVLHVSCVKYLNQLFGMLL